MQHGAFRGHLEGQGRADRTVTEYVRVVARADRWLLAHEGVQLVAASAAQVRRWADTLPASWASRKQARTALKHWQGWVGHPEDLAAAVRVPRKPKMRCRALTDPDAAAVELAAHRAGRRGLAVLLGLYLGMRCSEIAAASWAGYGDGMFEWRRAKSGDVARLPVHPRLAAALDEAERWGPWLFPSVHAPHVAAGTVWGWCRDIGASVGVNLSTHQLRHTCISRIVDEVGLRVGQAWAGHRDPEVTAGYSRVPETRLLQAMGSLSWDDDDAA